MKIISSIIASVSGHDLIVTGLWLAVAGIAYWVISWALNEIKVAEPFNKILRVIAAIAAAGFAIYEIVKLVEKV